MTNLPRLFRASASSVCLAFVQPVWPASAPPASLPDLEWFEPGPALLAHAGKAGFATDRFETGGPGGALSQGCSVTFLVVHVEKRREQHWMVEVRASELSEREKGEPPLQEERLYTTTGNEHIFEGAREAVAIHILGPVQVAQSGRIRQRAPKDLWSGAIVNGDHLLLGLDRASMTIHRLTESAREGDSAYGLSWRRGPFSAEEIETARLANAGIGLTPADERALVGCSPALTQFFLIAASTTGVRDILRGMLDLGVWSLLARGGRLSAVDFELLSGAAPFEFGEWWTPDLAAHVLPVILRIDGRPSLIGSLGVVEPRPPFAVSAGIVFMAVHRYDDPSSRLIVRAIASRNGRVVE